MEQEDSINFLDSFKGQTVDNIEYISDAGEDLIKITFTNHESFVVTGDLDIYLALPKDTEFH